MFIDTNNIGEKGLSIADSISLDENLLVEEGSFFLEDLDYDVRFMRSGNQINAKGYINTAVSLPCARCLEEFEFKVNSHFDVVLFPSNLVTSNNISLNDEEIEYIFEQIIRSWCLPYGIEKSKAKIKNALFSMKIRK